MSEQKFKLAAALLLCTTILASVLAFQYSTQLQASKHEYDLIIQELEETTIVVDIQIDDGETVSWFNETRVPLGASFLNATGMITDLEMQSSEWGVFVETINGVGGDSDKFWVWDYYDEGWQMGSVGADQWILHEGDILRWTYTSFE